MSPAIILLKMAIVLLLAIQSHPEASPELRAQAISVANQAIAYATIESMPPEEIIQPVVEHLPTPTEPTPAETMEPDSFGNVAYPRPVNLPIVTNHDEY